MGSWLGSIFLLPEQHMARQTGPLPSRTAATQHCCQKLLPCVPSSSFSLKACSTICRQQMGIQAGRCWVAVCCWVNIPWGLHCLGACATRSDAHTSGVKACGTPHSPQSPDSSPHTGSLDGNSAQQKRASWGQACCAAASNGCTSYSMHQSAALCNARCWIRLPCFKACSTRRNTGKGQACYQQAVFDPSTDVKRACSVRMRVLDTAVQDTLR